MSKVRLLIELSTQELSDLRIFFANLAMLDYIHNTPDEVTARRAAVVGDKLFRVLQQELDYQPPAANPDELVGILRRAKAYTSEARQGRGDKPLERKIDEAISMLLPHAAETY